MILEIKRKRMFVTNAIDRTTDNITLGLDSIIFHGVYDTYYNSFGDFACSSIWLYELAAHPS